MQDQVPIEAPSTTKETTTMLFQTDGDMWQERYWIAYNNQIALFKRFADWYDGMYTIVSSKNYSLWRSKVYIPILGSKVWNMVAKFIALKPGFEVRLRNQTGSTEDIGDSEQAEDAAYKAQLKLEYDYDNPTLDEPIREKLLSSLIDCAVTGTGIAKVGWETCKEVRYEYPKSADGTVDMSKEKKFTTFRGYNNLIPVNIFNVFVAPAAHGLYTAPWIIIKDYKTLAELQAINDAKGVEVYRNLSSLKGTRARNDKLAIYKKSRNRLTVQFDPIIADKTVDFIEIFECYDRSTNQIITYAAQNNGSGNNNADNKGSSWVEIRRQNNPYWHGKYPLVRFVVKKRPFEFWGEGIWETNHRLQAAANDVFNHYLDNWNLSVDGMLISKEDAGINDYIVEPGGLVTYRTEEPKQFKFPEPNPAALNMVMEQIMGHVERNTISSYATGIADSDIDKTRGTKGGIEALQQAADDMTSFMRMNFQESIKQVGQMFLSNNQQFLMQEETIQVPKGPRMVQVTIKPSDLQNDMELRVDEASMMPTSDDQMRTQYSAFVQQLMALQTGSMQQFMQLGTEPISIDYSAVLEEMAEKFGLRNANKLLTQAPPGPGPATQMELAKMQMQAAGKQGGPQQPQPTIQDKMIENLNYKDVPDDIKRQMEAQAGFQPSQSGVNSSAPGVAKANQQTLDMAHQLHAQGMLHPAVLDMVRAHVGQQAAPAGPAAPIGPPVEPAPQPAAQGAVNG